MEHIFKDTRSVLMYTTETQTAKTRQQIDVCEMRKYLEK